MRIVYLFHIKSTNETPEIYHYKPAESLIRNVIINSLK